jgi:hypothetical protein
MEQERSEPVGQEAEAQKLVSLRRAELVACTGEFWLAPGG